MPGTGRPGRGSGGSDNNLLEAEPRVIISIPGPGCPADINTITEP